MVRDEKAIHLSWPRETQGEVTVMNQPIKDVRVQDFHLSFVTVEWGDGQKRTVGTANPADLVTIGILVKSGESPETFDQRFVGRLCAEPKTVPDLLRQLAGSEN